MPQLPFRGAEPTLVMVFDLGGLTADLVHVRESLIRARDSLHANDPRKAAIRAFLNDYENMEQSFRLSVTELMQRMQSRG